MRHVKTLGEKNKLDRVSRVARATPGQLNVHLVNGFPTALQALV